MKKNNIFVILGVLNVIVLLYGCHTIGNSAKGAVEGAVKGAKQDSVDCKQAVQKADAWVKKNLW
ncbi:hypothetical protein D4R78_05465 [bacterium]|nr:MAG: hypothetical protein D4R78_05465 [bacterium]